MFPTPPTSHPSSSPSTRPIDDDDDDPDARDAHLVFHPTRQPTRAAPDPTSLSLPASVSASASSSRSVTPSYLPATSISSPVTPSATPSPAMSPGAPPLIKSKSHASAAGYTNYPHQNVNASPSAGQPWLLRPVARAPSAESLLRFSPSATASRTSLAPEMASVHPETYPHSGPHFPLPPSPSLSPPMQNLTLQNHSPRQSPTMAARVPSNLAHPLPRSTHTPPPPLRKQHSAYTLGGGAEAGRGHGYYNHGARGTPPLQELPPIHAQITANSNRKASTSVSTSSSASAYTSSTPTSPTGMATSPTTTNTSYTAHTTSSISTSPPEELLSAPTSPADNKALPPLPSSSRFPPHSHGPRKAVSHNNMRTVRTRARPATTEGVVGNRGIGVGTIEEVTPWEVQAMPESGTRARGGSGAGAQSVRSRASSTALGATGPVEEVTPWEVQTLVEENEQEFNATISSGSSGKVPTSTKSANSATRQRPPHRTKERSDSHSTTAPSMRSRASSAAVGSSSYALGAGAGGSVATGPVEEVTPWEVQVPTSANEDGESGQAPRTSIDAYGVPRVLEVDAAPFTPLPTTPGGAVSVRSDVMATGTGAVEEVTPWEVQAGPGETVYGMSREVRVPGVEQERERERSRSMLSFHSSGSGGYSVPKTAGSTSMANGSAYNNNTTGNNNGDNKSVRSGRSRASSAVHSPGGVSTTSTGSVEEVTPWEMYPAPPALHSPPPPLPTQGPMGHSTRNHEQEGEKKRRWGRKAPRSSTPAPPSSSGTGAVAPSIAATTSTDSSDGNCARSVKSTHTHKSTGAVEDVTPWEVQELPSSPPLPPSVVTRPPLPPRAATLESSFSYHATASAQAITATRSNPIHGVGEFAPARSSAPRRTSAATTSTTGSAPSIGLARPHLPAAVVEEVTPWEFAGALPVQVERITANGGPGHAPLGVTVEVHLPGENKEGQGSAHRNMGEGQELEVPHGWGEGSTPNTATFSTSSGHHSGSGYGPPPSSATSHASYVSTVPSYVSNASTTTGASRSVARGSMTLEQLSEVMPWELHPVPTKVGAEMSAEEKAAKDRGNRRAQESTAHARQSTSAAGAGGAVAQALAEFGLRRRRSTGASGAEPVASGSTGSIEGGSATVTKNTKKGAKLTRMSTSGVAGVGGVSSSDMMPPADAAAYPGPHPASTAAATSLKRKGKGRADTVNDDANDRFSTADRTILEELTASIRAREAQFKLKGVGHTVLGGGRGPGKKYHPYATDEVPYPRAYGKDVIDLDVWETLYFMDMTDSLSFHVFESPPTKVLEIGCGTGTWLLHGARTWKECHFVGLDIVPLHPDLRNVGSPDLASRITWVQHNFLEGLPFQNEEFDFVHIKRIALGVPENKWDLLFEEVARVMKPGARLEIIEEDLFFPGKKADDDDDDQATFVHDEKSSMTRRDSTSSDQRRTSSSTNGNDEADRDTVRLENVSEQSEVTSPPTPKSHNVQLLNGMDLERPASPSRTASVNGHPVSSQEHLSDHLKFVGGGRHHQRSHLVFPPARDASGSSLSSMAHDGVIPPHSRSTSRPTLLPKPKDPYPEFTMGTSSAAVLGVMAYHDPFADEIKKLRKQEAAARKNNAPMQGSQKTKPSPLLTTLMTKGPINPRDHTILEAIWEGMLEARFVNSTPTSVLQTYLEYHFTGIRTHPPLIYTFPPIPPKVEESDDEDEPPSAKLRVSGPSESDTDDARDAIVTRPKPKAKPRSNLSSNSVVSMTSSEEKRYLSMVSLVQRESPFVSFDNARTYAYSPAKNALFRAKIDKRTTDKDSLSTSEPYIMPRMPNTTLHIDLNPLNMQLTLRAKEIVACSESMWEWVEELQNGPASDNERSGMATPWYVGGVDAMADSDVTRSIILDMTREDFDRLLCNFEWDMLDKACMGQALADRFNWHTFEGALLADRKAYNKACMDYDKWLEEDLRLKAAKDAYQCTQNQSHNSVSSLGGVLSPPDLSSHGVGQIARSSSNPESSSASLAPSIRTLMDDRSSMATLAAPSRTLPETASAGSGSGVVEVASMVSSIPSSQMLPQQMLSRAIRVFVAWKAM